MTTRIALLGTGWISGVFADAARDLPGAEVSVCCGRRPEATRAFAEGRGIPTALTNIEAAVAREDVDLVIVGLPNDLHAPAAIAALEAGKDVLIEKPLALNLEEARAIIAAAERNDGLVGYAENLCFVPKFAEARRRIAAGDLGSAFFMKQTEKHDGPHNPWFFDRLRAGGGALMDMGCHSIALARDLFGKPAARRVWAHMSTRLEAPEGGGPALEDHVVIHVEFEGGAAALLESGWCLKGGMASTLEVQGSEGVLRAPLMQEGMGFRLYREDGQGWRDVDWAWSFQNGYPQELAEMLAAMKERRRPRESAEDGLAVLEIIIAAYASAGQGRVIELPFESAPAFERPVDLWLDAGA